MTSLIINHALVSLAEVQEPARNPNQMSPDDFEALRLVIREKGFFQPPLLRRINSPGATWEIVDGVHRVRALRLEGLSEVQAVCTDMDAQTARIVQVTMNRLRGDLNMTAVAETVRELVDANVPIETIHLMGYGDNELRAMLDATKVDTDDDVLASTSGYLDDTEEEEPPAPKPYIFEATFATSAELRKVKRVLKKAGNGDIATGLLNLINGA